MADVGAGEDGAKVKSAIADPVKTDDKNASAKHSVEEILLPGGSKAIIVTDIANDGDDPSEEDVPGDQKDGEEDKSNQATGIADHEEKAEKEASSKTATGVVGRKDKAAGIADHKGKTEQEPVLDQTPGEEAQKNENVGKNAHAESVTLDHRSSRRTLAPNKRLNQDELLAEKARQLRKSRGGYLSNLNRLYKECEKMIADGQVPENIIARCEDVDTAFHNLVSANRLYIGSLTNEDKIEEAEMFIFDQRTSKAEFDTRVTEWLTEKKRLSVSGSDMGARSVASAGRSGSGGSRRSGQSSSSSTRLREAKVKLALAKLKVEQTKARQPLIKKQQDLKMQEEMLQAKEEEESAKVECEVWEASLEDTDLEPRVVSSDLNPEAPVWDNHAKNQVGAQEPRTVKEPEVSYNGQTVSQSRSQVMIGIPKVLEKSTHDKTQAEGHRAVHGVGDSSRSTNGSSDLQVSDVPTPTNQANGYDMTSTRQCLDAQTNAYQQMAAAVRDTLNIPKPELLTFAGDPTQYWRFVNNFKANLNSVADDRVRLNYLIQHGKGEAKEAIEDCVILEPTEGYQEALDILSRMYGRPHVIARAYINQLINGTTIKPNDSNGLSKLGLLMQRCQMTLTQMGYTSDLNNSENLLKIVRRLPMHVRVRWAEKANSVIESGSEPSFTELMHFVQARARVANTMYVQDLNVNQEKGREKPKGSFHKGRTFATQSQQGVPGAKPPKTKGPNVCQACSKNHQLHVCYSFKAMDLAKRKAIMRQNQLCHNCFIPGHFAKGCMQKSACTVQGCKYKHNSLLHTDEVIRSTNTAPVQEATTPSNTTTESSTTPSESTNAEGVTLATGAGSRQIYLKVVPVRVRNHGTGESMETYALLDNCSDVSLCSDDLVKKLGLEGFETSYSLSTVNKGSSRMKGLEVSLSVESLDGKETIEIDNAWTVSKIPVSRENIPSASQVKQWPHLSSLHLPQVSHDEVTLLIGANVPEVFWTLEERKGGRKEPYAVRSLLGWTLIGPIGATPANVGHVNFISTREDPLYKQVERMWNTDFNESTLTAKTEMSLEDRRALAKMKSTIQKIDGHYQLDLPWRLYPPPLKNNRAQAELRLQQLKKRLSRNESLHRMYKKAMDDYITQGHATPVSQKLLDDSEDLWFIPHHPVTHPRKPEKVRVVFDCAAKFHGTSLNEQLLCGPDLTNNLVGVLTRFREAPVALTADIEGMFNQVKVSPDHRRYLRFLWWPNGDLSLPAQQYQMNVHLFGATSSPSCVNFSLRKTAEDNQEHFPEVISRTVQRNFYVDDCLKATKTTTEALEVIQQLPELLRRGGFHITKWVCNDQSVMEAIPLEERAPPVVDLCANQHTSEKPLGVKWDVTSDVFFFETIEGKQPATRRGILSAVSSLFDPLGLLAPLILPAKQILQGLCKKGLGWDDPLEDDQVARWQNWLDSVQRISEIKISRCVIPAHIEPNCEFQLHHFSDASESGYGAASYLRVTDAAGQIHCSLLIGKSRLTPLKVVTIPRLELTAATVAVKLDLLLKQELDLPIHKTVFWTDSTSVLQYISNESRRYQTFVANRVSTIREHSTLSQWKHISTTLNPADYASRGLHMDDSDKIKTWMNGPEFLWQCEALWPVQITIPGLESTDPELKKGSTVNYVHVDAPQLLTSLADRCSSWLKLQRWVVWFLRFKKYISEKYIQGKESVSQGAITVGEMRAASNKVLRCVQKDAFKDDYRDLEKGKEQVKSSSNLRRLCPVMIDGLMRVGGRLEKANQPYDVIHPIILPKKNKVTNMIIQSAHSLEGHAGASHVLAVLRQKYWIINGRSTVKQVLNKCTLCRRQIAPKGEQVMAALPEERITPDDPPFFNVGIDYFGPFHVKVGRSSAKRYGCIFTCMASRAVHIELAGTLETDSFICALKRFISRRGKPKKIRSDNGTNFRGAERELKEALAELNCVRVQRFLLQHEIEWDFNPPSASHMGGVWERMIRSVRQILCRILKEQLPSEETLTTTLTEVEKVLNDRPLTTVSDDPRDLEPLTPSQVLLLRSNSCLPFGVSCKNDIYSKRRWRQAQYFADLFWRRWVKEYLPTLQERHKWTTTRRNYCVDDLVLVVNEPMPRGQWPLGRVAATFPDRHGNVRSVKVRTSETELVRPITKICLLEGHDDKVDPIAERARTLRGRGAAHARPPVGSRKTPLNGNIEE